MISISEQDIADRVKQSLKSLALGDRFRVVDEQVRRENDWWYVPVLPDSDLDRDDRYYDLLADVEDEMRDAGTNVTLVPTSNIIKLIPHRASLRPLHINASDWQRLCDAAGIQPLKELYDRSECQRIAQVIRGNPAIINFDPPGHRQTAIEFFSDADGLDAR